MPYEQKRQRRVSVEVCDVIKPASVDARGPYFDVNETSQSSVGGIDDGGYNHQKQGDAIIRVASLDDENGHSSRSYESSCGVEVNTPGEVSPVHQLSSVRLVDDFAVDDSHEALGLEDLIFGNLHNIRRKDRQVGQLADLDRSSKFLFKCGVGSPDSESL